MFQSFIPFPTALMGEYPMNPLAVSLFGVGMTVNTLLFIALQSYILRNLIKPGDDHRENSASDTQIFCRRDFLLLGVAATFFNVHVAFVLYALTPLFFITPPQASMPPNNFYNGKLGGHPINDICDYNITALSINADASVCKIQQYLPRDRISDLFDWFNAPPLTQFERQPESETRRAPSQRSPTQWAST